MTTRATIGCLLALTLPVEAAQCRLTPEDCALVAQEIARENRASAEADEQARGLEPAVAIRVLGDLKVRRMVARAGALPKPIAKEVLRIAACDLDAEVARRGGRPSSGDC